MLQLLTDHTRRFPCQVVSCWPRVSVILLCVVEVSQRFKALEEGAALKKRLVLTVPKPYQYLRLEALEYGNDKNELTSMLPAIEPIVTHFGFLDLRSKGIVAWYSLKIPYTFGSK